MQFKSIQKSISYGTAGKSIKQRQNNYVRQ